MQIINFLEFNEQSEIIDYKNFDSELYGEDDFKEIISSNNIADSFGEWLIIDEVFEVKNKKLKYYNDQKRNTTWNKLPSKYVQEKYLKNYDDNDKCPIEIDVLVRENGYPIGVLSNCKSIKQAKVSNNLDGYKYNAILGIQLDEDYFLNFDSEENNFKLFKIKMNWNRDEQSF